MKSFGPKGGLDVHALFGRGLTVCERGHGECNQRKRQHGSDLLCLQDAPANE
jgi:hypothetical protein